jgi:serine/threonine protein kinase
MKRGIKIGDYVLAELLNTGGMGQVWLAHRDFEGGGRTAVAIKFPHAAGVLDPRVRDGLLDEARLQMQLQHENIPRVIDMGVHEGLPYFVMSFIPGRSLAELLARLRDVGTPLRLEIIAHIAREIGYSLRYAHRFEVDKSCQQVIHRDVAPKNVLISGHGGVFVVDFGVAEALGVRSSRNHIKGTLLYMAPEHALGFPSPKSDGWGLGAILWEMIEGRQFRAEVPPDDMRRAANQGLCGPLTRAGLPDALRFVTEGLLRKDESERLTIEEALRPLESPEFSPQRTALAEELKQRFGASVHRSGQTLHDFEMPEQLDRTLAAAKMVREGRPWEPDTWSSEAFAAAGAPIVVPVGSTRPSFLPTALDDESVPRTVRPELVTERRVKHELAFEEGQGGSGVVRTEPLPHVDVLRGANEVVVVATEPMAPPSGARGLTERVPRPATEALPAMERQLDEIQPPLPIEPHALDITAVWDVEPSATSGTTPASAASTSVRVVVRGGVADAAFVQDVPAATEPRAPSSDVAVAPSSIPAIPKRSITTVQPSTSRPRALVGTVAALALVVAGVVWAAWPLDAAQELKPATEPRSTMAEFVGPPAIEVEPAPVPEAPAVVGEQPVPIMPTEEPVPEPVVVSEPVVVPEPVVVAPAPVETPQLPPTSTTAAKPVRKKTTKPRPPSPPVELTLALSFFADVDVELNGVRFSLSGRKPTIKTTVPAGKVRTRWRRPLGEWKRKTFMVEPGVRYKVFVDDRGLELRPLPQKTP